MRSSLGPLNWDWTEDSYCTNQPIDVLNDTPKWNLVGWNIWKIRNKPIRKCVVWSCKILELLLVVCQPSIAAAVLHLTSSWRTKWRYKIMTRWFSSWDDVAAGMKIGAFSFWVWLSIDDVGWAKTASQPKHEYHLNGCWRYHMLHGAATA